MTKRVLVTVVTGQDGTMRKLMDVNRFADMGWKARIGFKTGVRETYQWFLDHHNSFRG